MWEPNNNENAEILFCCWDCDEDDDSRKLHSLGLIYVVQHCCGFTVAPLSKVMPTARATALRFWTNSMRYEIHRMHSVAVQLPTSTPILHKSFAIWSQNCSGWMMRALAAVLGQHSTFYNLSTISPSSFVHLIKLGYFVVGSESWRFAFFYALLNILISETM